MKKKRQGPRIPLTRFVGMIALSVSIILIINLGGQAAANYRVQREAYRLAQDVEALQKYQAGLLARRTYVASDLYVEEVARNELKWAKPNETVVVILPTSENGQQLPVSFQADSVSSLQLSPPQAWWQFFFGSKSSQLRPTILPQTDNIVPPAGQASANLKTP